MSTPDGIIKVIDMDSITDAGAHATHCFTTTTAGEHKSIFCTVVDSCRFIV